MTKLVILTGRAGDLCNRLFRFARFYCAKPPGIWMLDATMYQFVYLFRPKTLGWHLLFFLLRLLNRPRLDGLVRILESLPAVEKINPPESADGEFCRSLRKFYEMVSASPGRIILVDVSAFYMRADVDWQKHLPYLGEIFRLKPRYEREATRLLQDLPKEFCLVGVHLRRRDYRTFVDGKLFFDDAECRREIQSLLSTYKGAKPLLFILVCEEPVDIKNFHSLPVRCFGPSCIGLDQAILERCDYIIGSPSTFNGWVGFLREIPRAEFKKNSPPIAWNDFGPTNCNYPF